MAERWEKGWFDTESKVVLLAFLSMLEMHGISWRGGECKKRAEQQEFVWKGELYQRDDNSK